MRHTFLKATPSCNFQVIKLQKHVTKLFFFFFCNVPSKSISIFVFLYLFLECGDSETDSIHFSWFYDGSLFSEGFHRRRKIFEPRPKATAILREAQLVGLFASPSFPRPSRMNFSF